MLSCLSLAQFTPGGTPKGGTEWLPLSVLCRTEGCKQLHKVALDKHALACCCPANAVQAGVGD